MNEKKDLLNNMDYKKDLLYRLWVARPDLHIKTIKSLGTRKIADLRHIVEVQELYSKQTTGENYDGQM